MTERTTRKQVMVYHNFVNQEVMLLLKDLKKKDKLVGYEHWGNRWCLTIDGKKIGHFLLTGEFYSMLVGMNALLEEIRRED